MKFKSSKRIGPISTGHRQWKDDGHCRFIHGYGRYVEFTFACNERDESGWVMDFGNLKSVRKWLEREWDHRLLVAHDDPQIRLLEVLNDHGVAYLNIMPKGYGPGIEDSCKYVYDKVNPMIKEITDGRVWIEKVRVYEHENNWAEYGL